MERVRRVGARGPGGSRNSLLQKSLSVCLAAQQGSLIAARMTPVAGSPHSAGSCRSSLPQGMSLIGLLSARGLQPLGRALIKKAL